MTNRKYFESAYIVFLWVGSWLAFVYMLRQPIEDPDFWWNLAVGRELFEHKKFLYSDIFSHTHYGAPWINFEWLSQWIMYGIYKQGGFWGLYLGKIIFGITALALIHCSCYLIGARRDYLILLMWLAFAGVGHRLWERPELATMNLFPLFICLLIVCRKWSRSKLRWMPAIFFTLMVLWCNLHGGFIYGLGLVVLINVGARWNGESRDYINTLDRIFVVCLAAMLINPNGAKLLLVFIEHFFQLRGKWIILEWRPTGINDAFTYWSLMMVCGVSCLWKIYVKSNSQTKLWLPSLLVFFLYGLKAIRNVIFSPMLALPFLAGGVTPAVSPGQARLRKKANLLGILFFAILTYSSHKKDITAKILGVDIPIRQAAFIKEHNIQGVMYNEYGDGGYLDWALGPERKVLMDGRYLFYDLLAEKDKIYSGSVQYAREKDEKFLERYAVTYAIVSSDQYNHRVMFPEKSWALVQWDDHGLVFLKRLPMYDGLIRKYEYKFLNPAAILRGPFEKPKDLTVLNRYRRELERHRQEVGHTKKSRAIEKLLQN